MKRLALFAQSFGSSIKIKMIIANGTNNIPGLP